MHHAMLNRGPGCRSPGGFPPVFNGVQEVLLLLRFRWGCRLRLYSVGRADRNPGAGFICFADGDGHIWKCVTVLVPGDCGYHDEAPQEKPKEPKGEKHPQQEAGSENSPGNVSKDLRPSGLVVSLRFHLRGSRNPPS